MKSLLLSLYLLFLVLIISGQPSGSLDLSFNGSGYVITDAGNIFCAASSMAIQEDGKIIVAGFSKPYDINDFEADFVIMRHNVDGSLDSDFGVDGIVLTDLDSGSSDVATDIAIQADGKIVVAGRTHAGNTFEDYGMALIRYNNDGSIDESFGNLGIAKLPIDSEDDYSYDISMLIQTDGKIVLTGSTYIVSNDHFITVRYDQNGEVDPSFGNNGIVISSFGDDFSSNPNAIAIQTDGKIICGGVAVGPQSTGTYADFGLIRYLPSGTPDPTFGIMGKVITPVLPGFDTEWIEDIEIQDDGKIIAVGCAATIEDEKIAIVRYNMDGSLDPFFGDNGIVLTEVSSPESSGQSVTLDINMNILVAGYTGNSMVPDMDFAIVKYISDGTIDHSFGTEGKVLTHIHEIDVIADLHIQEDGKLVVAGLTGNYELGDFIVARYFDLPVGISDLPMESEIKIFPNPVIDILNLEININTPSYLELSIYNIIGQPLLSESFRVNSNHPMQISIETLNSGVYILEIRDQYDHRMVKRFVKK